MINYKANIWAFKELGVKRIIAPSAVGSLKEEFAPGHFALPSQFLDFTKSRDGSFSENGRVIHISVADPFCPELQDLILKVAQNQKITMHKDCTYVCIEGPRFSTKAESKFFRTTNGVLETLSKNVVLTKNLLTSIIDKIPKTRGCYCEKALSEAEF